MIQFDDNGWLRPGKTFVDGVSVDLKIDKTPNTSGRLDPSRGVGIIEHYTATRSAHGAQGWLDKPGARASAHFVVGDDDEPVLWQAVSLFGRSWHAGDGRWKGRNPNDFCIGIEHSCAGWLTKRGDGYYTASGEKMPPEEVVFGPDHHGREMAWDNYDPITLGISRMLHSALYDFFAKQGWRFLDCQPHSFVAPTLKWDTGPHFPMGDMRSIMGGRIGQSSPLDFLKALFSFLR